jgi:hypothetical protein
MFECPFAIINCSWPRPIEYVNGCWIFAPAWDAPLMPVPPQPRWEVIHDELCWAFHWSELFQCDLKPWDPIIGGEMRGFHIVFRLQIKNTGTFVFWSTDGCSIRNNGQIIYDNRNSHRLTRGEIRVTSGDHLEIAQWHLREEWQWGAYMSLPDQTTERVLTSMFAPYLRLIQERFRHAHGPALKMYTSGHAPLRTIVAIYSMVLNGYTPSGVYLFGEHQWEERARYLFASWLPFAHVVSTQHVITQLQSLGEPRLVAMAQEHWFVMKLCTSLLYPPAECCIMDDDVFILERLDDALKAFQENNLVYEPDLDQSADYIATWGRQDMQAQPLPTARFNAGLYWIRNTKDQNWLARQAVRVEPNPKKEASWEQGFIATVFEHEHIMELPSQRYFYPVLDGLPGGVRGYDYLRNPCGFASIHFGGFVKKPSEGVILHLVPHILKGCVAKTRKKRNGA